MVWCRLNYPSSDEENYSDDTDSDKSLPDLTNLKAFDFELTCAPREIQTSDEESEVDRTRKVFAARTPIKSQKNYLKVY